MTVHYWVQLRCTQPHCDISFWIQETNLRAARKASHVINWATVKNPITEAHEDFCPDHVEAGRKRAGQRSTAR